VKSPPNELAGPARFEQVWHEHTGIHVGKVNSETPNRRFLNECLGLRVNAETRKSMYVMPADACGLCGLVSLDGRHWPVSRAKHSMNRFRKRGFVEYNSRLRVQSGLLSVVLHDYPACRSLGNFPRPYPVVPLMNWPEQF
jgi:hypothetical protein